MLDTEKQKPLYQVFSALPMLIPKELLKLVRSNVKVYALPNPVQRFLPNSTKEGGLYVYKLFFSPAYTCVLLKYF